LGPQTCKEKKPAQNKYKEKDENVDAKEQGHFIIFFFLPILFFLYFFLLLSLCHLKLVEAEQRDLAANVGCHGQDGVVLPVRSSLALLPGMAPRGVHVEHKGVEVHAALAGHRAEAKNMSISIVLPAPTSPKKVQPTGRR
jgi:hypothetical protein